METLRDNPKVSPEQAQRFYDIIDVEAERLEHLINDILSLSEAEQGKIKNISRFDLSELIDEVIVLLDDQASDKKVCVYTEDSLPGRHRTVAQPRWYGPGSVHCQAYRPAIRWRGYG